MKFEKLGNIAEIIAGQSPPSSSYNKEGKGIPFFQGKADYGVINPVVRNWCTNPTKISLRGDILISVRAPVGPVNLNNIEACIGRGLSAIRVKENISRDYLFSYLKASEEKISKLGVGSTFKAITQKDLKELIIPIPKYTTQRQIANILSKAENLIVQRKESIALLDEFLKSTFLEMFGDPVRNEKGWKKIRLEDVSKIQGGLQVTSKRKTNPIELPYLRVANVYRNYLDLREIKTIRVTEAEADRIRLEKGDILIVEGHGNPTEIGRSAIWDDSIQSCLHQNHLIRVRVNREVALPVYISYYINSSGGRRQMFKAGKTTSGLNTISSKNVKETLILLPPIELQTQFAQIVEKTEALKAQYQQSLQELVNLYGSLSQRAFKGELKLGESEAKMFMAADLDTSYQTQTKLSIPTQKKGFAKLVLAGKIINECKDRSEFTNIKFQKLQHLAEHLMEADLNLNYYNQAAGPYDNRFMHTLHEKMKQQKWFSSRGYKYYPMEKVKEIDGHFSRYFGVNNGQFSKLIELLGKASQDQCEIVSTLYAVWNDRIIRKEPTTYEAIIADFLKWSERKQKYTTKQLNNAIKWMKEKELDPKGFGVLIKHRKKK